MKKTAFNIYLGTFLIAFSTLGLEVTLARLLSVVSFYHLAFFAVSAAMLGMTAGAVSVYLKRDWFTENNLSKNTAIACLLYAVSVPIALSVVCLVPLGLVLTLSKVIALLVITAACSLPFYFSGIVLSVVLTKYDLPIGKLYASDMTGASLGCLFVLGGLEIFDAPSLIILTAAFGLLSVFCFAYRIPLPRIKPASSFILIIILFASTINFYTNNIIRPVHIKGIIEDPSDFIYVKWNSFSRIAVFKGKEVFPENWGPSPVMPPESRAFTYQMHIDGDAGTYLSRFTNLNDISHLRYDITNVAYYLREKDSSACIIGVGAGKDIQSAILFGYKRIVGIDVNPIFIDLLRNKFRTEAGIASRKEVELIVDEGRSYLSRSDEKFSMIQMALLDTWAATGAGAYTLSENSLYTLEAWKVILNHLSDKGLFTLSRWYSPNNLGETGRAVCLAVASLFDAGIKEPSKHIAMLVTGRLSTLIISKNPLSEADISKLKQTASALKFELVIVPGEPPANSVIGKIISAKSAEELYHLIENEPLNYTPPTDENPYFFNMLRLSHLKEMKTSEQGIIHGNLTASITLIVLIFSLMILSALTIVIPLIRNSKKSVQKPAKLKVILPAALYFSLIGAGFMFVEIGMLQRLSIFLGHPVYALGILLFTIILGAGIGSYFSERLTLTVSPRKYFYPAITAIAVLAMRFIVSFIIVKMITEPIFTKILVSICLILPIGFLLGLFFPTGMKIVKARTGLETPWFWALNGIFGVLCSAIAVFNAIYFGISVNFYIAFFCYTFVLFLIGPLTRPGKEA